MGASERAATPEAIDPSYFREVLGYSPTGVSIITGLDDQGDAAGMVVGTFVSVSLDPPLVGFLPARSSTSWPRIAGRGRFCVNILGAGQEELCRRFAQAQEDRFAGIPWQPGVSGSPVLDDVLAWVDCEIEAIHSAGDHDFVVGRVINLGVRNPEVPLVFLRGGYGGVAPLSFSSFDPTVMRQLRNADSIRAVLQAVAFEQDAECIAMAAIGDDIVLAASAAPPGNPTLPPRFGQRLPFTPPLGTLFVAWADDKDREAWLARLPRGAQSDVDAAKAMIDRARDRGYSLATGAATHARFEEMLSNSWGESADAPVADAWEAVAEDVDPVAITQDPGNEVRSIAAPVFEADGRVAVTIGVYGLPRTDSAARIEERAHLLVKAATDASAHLRKALPTERGGAR